MRIKIPSTIGVEINNIEQQIINLHPSINNHRKDLSKIYTERVLIFLNEIRKCLLHNEQLCIKNRISEYVIKYAQICQAKRIRIFGETRDTGYTDSIQDEVLLKFVAIRPFEHPTLGTVDYYVPNKVCKQYYFINEPEAYIDYELTTKKGIEIANALTGIDIKNRDLSRENNEVRRAIISNTEKIFLDYNSSSKEILSHRLRKVRTTPKEYSNAFNDNQFKTLTDDFGHRGLATKNGTNS